MIGHNGGPPLDDDDPNAAWRLWCWRKAHKKAWKVPREIALRRLANAEACGVTYRDYTLEILERGRYLTPSSSGPPSSRPHSSQPVSSQPASSQGGRRTTP